MSIPSGQKTIKAIAKAGFITKGIIYCLIGILAFMAAFNINGTSAKETDKSDVLEMIQQQVGGQILLGSIALGLLCYTIWRALQAIIDTEDKGTDTKSLMVRGRYLFSALVYGSLAWLSIKMLFKQDDSSGDSGKQNMVEQLLSQPFGQWLVGIVSIGILAVGVYQINYGLSEKFKKHIDKSVKKVHRNLVLIAGKAGYLARGIVWLLIGVLFARAAIFASSSEAGSTSEAFQFLSTASYGKYLVAAVGLGLIFYGAFNFVRARYERFYE